MDPIQKAVDPDTLLSRPGQGFDLPNLRPIKSASPSPTAIVQRATIPATEFLQKDET
eukprot:CAMPEP_0198139094 /NCGR_PEP_ID=MMETSP1443-20131203/2435_1 /TAXON_ID=186043 /ORGANISM="Entomoneis sp., Strain CCMP2396" /LENGTH=56 /DNA_ID=CAMNT_0043801107 /DNA_START=159 /DNA_END=329 /DNA_ORIENTATION=-